jgi:hypothetical protein
VAAHLTGLLWLRAKNLQRNSVHLHCPVQCMMLSLTLHGEAQRINRLRGVAGNCVGLMLKLKPARHLDILLKAFGCVSAAEL